MTISVMTPTEKVVKKMIECGHFYQDRLEDLEIRDNLLQIVHKAKEDSKFFEKCREEILELELILTGGKEVAHPPTPRKVKKGQKNTANDGPVKKASRAPRGTRQRSQKANIAWSSDESDGDDEIDENIEEVIPVRSKRSRRKL